MGEEFSGLGSKIFFFCPDSGMIVEHDLDNNSDRVVRKSDDERRIDRIMATPPESIILPSEGGFHVVPTGFSASFSCELPESAEAEALLDMFSRTMPEERFDVQVLPSLYRKCYGRAPRKILKAMSHGGYYRRDTKWKRKAVALSKRDIAPSSHTIRDAKIETNDNGEVLILGRGVSKTQFIKQRKSKSLWP